MTKWKFMNVAVLCLLFASVPAMAQDDDEEDEEYVGCGMLGAGIGAAVVAAGTAGGANVWTVGLSSALGYGMHTEVDDYCNEVAERTVEAYENAMANLGIQILWHTFHDPLMPWCMSVKKYDCIPYIDPNHDQDPNQQLFVEQSWEAVRSAAETLIDGGIDNSARITPVALANALQTGFDQGGLHSSPSAFQTRFNGIQ